MNDEHAIRDALIHGAVKAADAAAQRFPNDNDAALRYFRELVQVEGAFDRCA